MKFRVLLPCLLIISQMAIAQENSESGNLYQEAYDNFVKRDYAAASAALDKINPVDQKKADVLNLRGAIYKRLGELDNAANAYADALKINPKDWVPKYNLAEVNFLREQYKSARSYLEQALTSMPEADRLQKQDLILYKVYLTYLLQGDEEKARLLLESFDINSPNPVYYFAQAAWSYKKKDLGKAKTWVDSTDGLYSQDLRNSYSQALVDVGWLEPSSGVGTVLNAAPAQTPAPSPAASPAPAEIAAAASPTPAGEARPAVIPPSIVPLATNDATPIPVVEATPPLPVEQAATPSATVSDVAVTKPANSEEKREFPLKGALLALGVIGATIFGLMRLAKSSRAVPPPEDNTGYDAIQASGSPEASAAIAFSSEGTGIVLEQDENGEIPAAPIKVSPIQRDYADSAPAAAAAGAAATKGSRRSTGAGAAAKTSKAAAGKTKTAAATTKAPAKITAPETPAAKPAKKTTKTAAKAPAPAAPEPAPAPAPIVEAAVAKAPAIKAAAAKKPKAAAGTTASKRAKLVPVPTIDVPPPENMEKIMVSNIETLRVDPSVTPEETPAAPAAPVKPAPKAKAPAKAATKSLAKAPAKAAAKPAPARPAAGLITIPEFEDANLEAQESPTIRVVSENDAANDETKNA
jgi:Tfp pilus assembly protein PilF